MNTYYFKEDWDRFKSFIFETIKDVNKDNTCFFHNNEEIFILTYDEKLIDLIENHYKLTLVEPPNTLDDKYRNWEYMGNTALLKILP